MAQPWRSPHTNSNDTKQVMDDILGRLNNELKDLTKNSRDLLNTKPDQTQIGNTSPKPTGITLNNAKPYEYKSFTAPKSILKPSHENVTIVPSPSKPVVQQADCPPKSQAYNNFPQAPPPTREQSMKNNTQTNINNVQFNVSSNSQNNNFPPPPLIDSDFGCINEEVLIEPSKVEETTFKMDPKTSTSKSKSSENNRTTGFKIDPLDDLLAGLEETPISNNKPLKVRTESVARNEELREATERPPSPRSQYLEKNKRKINIDDLIGPNAHEYVVNSPPVSPKPKIIPHNVRESLNSNQAPSSSKEKFDNGKISVYGPNMFAAKINEDAHFYVDLKNAGSGKLSGGMVGPADAGIRMENIPENIFKITYKTPEMGTYNITLKFEGVEIPGSPFNIKVKSDKSNQETVDDKKRKPSADNEKAIVGRILNFGLKLPNVSFESLSSNVVAPSSNVNDPLEIEEISAGNYNIKFKPVVPGLHRLNILCNNTHISGSPYDIEAENPKQGKASGCKILNMKSEIDYQKIDKADLHKQINHFKVDTTECGGVGSISIECKGPSKPDILVKGTGDVCWSISRGGKYTLNVKFNQEHVPGSPFEVKVLSN